MPYASSTKHRPRTALLRRGPGTRRYAASVVSSAQPYQCQVQEEQKIEWCPGKEIIRHVSRRGAHDQQPQAQARHTAMRDDKPKAPASSREAHPVQPDQSQPSHGPGKLPHATVDSSQLRPQRLDPDAPRGRETPARPCQQSTCHHRRQAIHCLSHRRYPSAPMGVRRGNGRSAAAGTAARAAVAARAPAAVKR